jgi:hypothetical protein
MFIDFLYGRALLSPVPAGSLTPVPLVVPDLVPLNSGQIPAGDIRSARSDRRSSAASKMFAPRIRGSNEMTCYGWSGTPTRTTEPRIYFTGASARDRLRHDRDAARLEKPEQSQ